MVDKDFMEFAKSKGCTLKRRVLWHICQGPGTFHHVRNFGSPKDDTHGFCLCAVSHLLGLNSRTSIEAGKASWESYWGVSIEGEIQKLRAEYQESKR